MTLTEAKDAIQRLGVPLGDVFERVEEHNRDILKEWFVRERGVPNLATRHGREPVYTGEVCRCGGFLARTGSCMTCQSCSESSGGCG